MATATIELIFETTTTDVIKEFQKIAIFEVEPLPAVVWVRSSSVLEEVTLQPGEATMLPVYDYYTSVAIDYAFDPHVRQQSGSELDWVTTFQNLDRTDVFIDATGVPEGQYRLILESYDTISADPEAIMTDIVTITVHIPQESVEVQILDSNSSLSVVTLVANAPSIWSLPTVLNQDDFDVEVKLPQELRS